MKTCLLVQGSPGAPAELEPLVEALAARDVKAERLRLPMSDASPVYTPLVEAARGVDLVVAYSFGCYLTLRAHEAGALPAKPLCLVSPHLIGREGLSGAARVLLGVPGLGRSILAKGLDKRVDDYLAQSYAPAQPPESVRQELMDPDLWLRAARWKQLQASAPLGPIDPAKLPPFRIVIGTADRSSPWSDHARAFTSPPDEAHITRVDGAGHALIHGHADRVADAALTLIRG
jgi:pimeloyl-ACP methyl ester carboxylesterase